MQELGTKIRRLRQKRSMTQEGLAEELELSVVALSRIERGRAEPSWQTVRRLADALDVSIDFLAGRPGRSSANKV